MAMSIGLDANGFPVRVDKAPDAKKEDVKEEPTPVASPAKLVNAEITWGQWFGSLLTDGPIFALAALPIVVAWLQSDVPISSRGLFTIIILAILAGLTAVLRVTGTDGLSMRLRAKGQISK